MSSTQFRVNRPYVIREEFDDEDVIVNLDNGCYYSLNKPGAMIWNLVEAGAGVDRVIERFCAAYEGDGEAIVSAVRDILHRFESENLIVAAGNGAAVEDKSDSVHAGAKQAFSPPVLQKYTDMQDMLFLDPVHEVDDAGWPNRKPDASEG